MSVPGGADNAASIALHARDDALAPDHPFVRGLDPNAANRVPLTPIAFCLEHGEAKVLLTDPEFARTP